MSLRQVRKAAGKKLVQAAGEMGVNPGNLSRWETGKVLPDTRTLQKLAAYYGVTVDELLRPDEPATQEAS